jgi:hypothetical protein
MGTWSWWFKIVIIGLFSVFFFIFGLEVFLGSYSLKNPHMFIMQFFSGSFIILISVIGILYPFFQIYAYFRPPVEIHEDE